MNSYINDFWKEASQTDWQDHVAQNLQATRILIEDQDRIFYCAIRVLSDAYLTLHQKRNTERPNPRNEHDLDDIFWDLQRSSTIIDSVVGSACVVLMRWMEHARILAIGALILLETRFPFEQYPEPDKGKWTHHCTSVMQDYGARVPGKQTGAALAVWHIGNVFKHGGSQDLHEHTKRVVKELGFSSGLFEISDNEGEEALRQLSLNEVAYTLDRDSIERMALQLGCGPTRGLMPLYDFVESWQKAIDRRLGEEQAAFQNLQRRTS